ncbi:flagellar biosynthetic protein FliQ [Bradyrhizobium sp. LM6.9]
MNERDALDIVQAAIWTIIVASGPAVGAAMLVGTLIALIQALTQIQEVTLTFVPKIIVILLVVAVSGSFIGAHLSNLHRDGLFAYRARLLIRAGSGTAGHLLPPPPRKLCTAD